MYHIKCLRKDVEGLRNESRETMEWHADAEPDKEGFNYGFVANIYCDAPKTGPKITWTCTCIMKY